MTSALRDMSMDEVLRSDAARCMMPGLVTSAPEPAPVMRSAIDDELLLLSLVAALQRVPTDPGSGDMAFIRGLRGKRAAVLSADDVQRVMHLRQKYRLRLPPGLRPRVPAN